MAAVRGLRVSVKAEASAGPALGVPSPEAGSGLERGEPEPMEVEEGELEIVPVRRSLKELIPVREGGGGLGGGRRASECPAPERAERGGGRLPGRGRLGKGREGTGPQEDRGAGLERPGARERTQGSPEMGVRGLREVGESRRVVKVAPVAAPLS